MANLNKVMLIGRLTRDPEVRVFTNGGKVASFGFAVTNRKKDNTGNWVDDPCFLDVKAFNRGDFSKLADRVEQSLRKGQQVFLEGHLVMESWEKDGQKRNKIVVYVDNLQYLEPRQEGGMGGGGMSRPQPQRGSAPAPSRSEDSFDGDYGDDSGSSFGGSSEGPPEETIPF